MVEAYKVAYMKLFDLLSDEQLEEVAKITEKKSYKIHDHIYERGNAAKHLFVVKKGLVSLRRIDPGDEVGIAFETREPGELFGAASFMKPQEYTLTAVCQEDTEVMAIDADRLFELTEKDPAVGYQLLLNISQIYFERYKTAKRSLHEMVRTPTIITALPG
ncbi:MAG: cyclic nucleotide-binding domain-containing protein [Deltaproteobacteria bacterium]|nr:cyclic nucleotide-binding domain-containing protein [Deltaproteobacteria bacterium]